MIKLTKVTRLPEKVLPCHLSPVRHHLPLYYLPSHLRCHPLCHHLSHRLNGLSMSVLCTTKALHRSPRSHHLRPCPCSNIEHLCIMTALNRPYRNLRLQHPRRSDVPNPKDRRWIHRVVVALWSHSAVKGDPTSR